MQEQRCKKWIKPSALTTAKANDWMTNELRKKYMFPECSQFLQVASDHIPDGS